MVYLTLIRGKLFFRLKKKRPFMISFQKEPKG